MAEISFSVLNHGPAAAEILLGLLQRFEQRYGIHVHLEIIPTWTLGWSRLVENALYRSGPDLSEAGSTWIGDVVRMEALRPFSQEETIDITKDTPLVESVWKSRIWIESGKAMIYSIPWLGDTRAVYYRRDLFEKAGIDEATAFIDIVQFEKTIRTLKEKGISMPLILTSQHTTQTIQHIASWIWGAGGDFLSQDGSDVAFNQPGALEGCKAFFRLGRYLVPEARNRSENDVELMFRSGKGAVTLNGAWLLNVEEKAPEIRKFFSVASMPGMPFVGGQDLVIWKHSRNTSASIKLIQFLNSEEAGKELFPSYGLPVSENTWRIPLFTTGFYPVFRKAIQEGRSFRGQLWGMIEKRLTDEYADIWKEVLKAPESELEKIVETRLNNLANRLQLSIGSS